MAKLMMFLSVLLLTLLSFSVGWVVGVEGKGVRWLVFTVLVMSVTFMFNLIVVSVVSAFTCHFYAPLH